MRATSKLSSCIASAMNSKKERGARATLPTPPLVAPQTTRRSMAVPAPRAAPSPSPPPAFATSEKHNKKTLKASTDKDLKRVMCIPIPKFAAKIRAGS